MSGHVVSVIFESGMVKNVGVAAETAAPALSGQNVFPLPVFVADIQGDGGGFRCWPMSGHDISVIFESCMVEKGGQPMEQFR